MLPRPALNAGTAALTALALMVCIPFLMPHHRLPIPTFFQEWWAIIFGLGAASVLLVERYREAFALPRIALLPLALAGVVLLQGALMPAVRGDMTLIAALVLLWASLLAGLARTLAIVHGERAVATALAAGIAVGALGSALVVALQWGESLRGTGLISSPIGNRLFGNLNQPNHLSLQLWLGIAALLYLFSGRRIAIGLLVFASLLSGSRAVVIYAALLPSVSLLQHRRGESGRSTLGLAVFALVTTAIGYLLLDALAEPVGATTLAHRTWGKDGHALRAGLWWMAGQMGLQNSISGVGWGRFSAESFTGLVRFGADAPKALILVPGEHAHNIFMQLFAELGATGPLLVIGFGGLWLTGTLRRRISSENFLALALVLLLLLHAQIEYTLWYAFFLGIAACALALGESSLITFRLPRPMSILLVLFASLGTAGLLRSDYTRLETTLQWPLGENLEKPRPWKEVSADLVSLRQRSRFGGYVDLVLVGAMRFDREVLPEKLALCDAAMSFSPTDYAVFKCAGLLALAGRDGEAQDRLERAMLAYPGQVEEFIRVGEAQVAEYPELRPLLDAARAHALSRGLIEQAAAQQPTPK
jgi:hypothetical protein